ncbi:MAG: hypothetical protein R2774_09295 [Saprospiraceae bacterium]
MKHILVFFLILVLPLFAYCAKDNANVGVQMIGFDTIIHLCSKQPINNLAILLHANENGVWEPKLQVHNIFNPNFDTPGRYSYIFTNDLGIQDTSFIEILIHPERMIELGPPIKMCRAERQTVDIPKKAGDVYSWNDGVTEPKRYIYSPGSYIVTLVTVEGCVLKDTLLILPSFEKVPKNVSVEICHSDTYEYKGKDYLPGETIIDSIRAVRGCDTLVTLQLIPIYPNIIQKDTFTCDNSSITIQNRSYVPGDTIISYLTDPLGCDTIVKTLYLATTIENIEILASDSILCLGATAILSTAHSSNLVWSNNATTPTTQVTAGIHHVRFVDNYGCFRYDTIQIQNAPIPSFTLTIDSVKCNKNNGVISIDNLNQMNTFDIYWNGVLSSTNTIENLASGQYRLTLKDRFDCTKDTTINIPEIPYVFDHVTTTLYVPKGIDTTLNLGFIRNDISIVDIELNNDVYIRDSLLIINGQSSKAYTITLEDKNGCRDVGTLNIEVIPIIEDVTLPNIISIQASNLENRSFFVKVDDVLYDLTVYDRWGNPRFSKLKIIGNSPSEGWTPDDIETGVYTYILEVYTPYVKIKKYGDVLVIK